MSLTSTRITIARTKIGSNNLAEQRSKIAPIWNNLIENSNAYLFFNNTETDYRKIVNDHAAITELKEIDGPIHLTCSNPENLLMGTEQVNIVVVKGSYEIRICPQVYMNNELKFQEEFERQLIERECELLDMIEKIYKELINNYKCQDQGFTPTPNNSSLAYIHEPDNLLGSATSNMRWDIEHTLIIGILTDVFFKTENLNPDAVLTSLWEEVFVFSPSFALLTKLK